MRVSDRMTAFRPEFRATGISDYLYRSTMAVIVGGMGTSPCAGENIGCSLYHLLVRVTSLSALVRCLGTPATHLRPPRIAVQQSVAYNVYFGNTTGECANRSYYLSFNDHHNSYIQFVFSFMHPCSYTSTHSISGLATGSDQ
jgi:hypothetical protein